MRRDKGTADLDRFIREAESKQENLVWPDMARNGKSVDEILWKGSPEATIVQRIGILLFGLCYFGFGVIFLIDAHSSGSYFMVAFSFGWLVLGVKVRYNGLRRRSRKSTHD
jgi:hypothetical protein